jgi:hypothetical protein
VLLAGAIVLCGLVTLPVVALMLLAFANRGGTDPAEVLTGALPALIGYPLAVVLWWRFRQHWVLAVLGVLVVIAVSCRPLAELAQVVYLQWQQTQPGGKGYQP